MPEFRTRLAFVYFLLYFFPFPISLFVPLTATAARRVGDLVGDGFARVSGLPVPITHNAGDSLLQYVLWGATVAAAIVVALLWEMVARARPGVLHPTAQTTRGGGPGVLHPTAQTTRGGGPGGERLDAWLRVYLRLVLGYTLIAYGTAKIVPAQFPSPPLDRLLQPIGDASPMGLLWAFMGASQGYSVFTGFVETIAGVLVMSRRVSLAGVLVSLAVVVNVAAINFGYDVPMKLFSLHLIAVALYLLAPDLPRLGDVVRGRTAGAPPLPAPLFAEPRWNRMARWVGGGFIVFALVTTLIDADATRRQTGDLAPASPIQGVWDVTEFLVDGAPTEPAARWRRMVFDRGESCAVQLADDTYIRLLLRYDEATGAIDLAPGEDTAFEAVLATVTYERPLPDGLVLTGTLRGRALGVRLVRAPVRPFLLRNRGFRWINESEFNR